MRVLVLGGTGFVGTAVMAELARRGEHPIGVGTSPRAQPDPAFPGAAPTLVAADLSEPGAAQRLLTERRPDAVINLAAVPDIGPCRAAPERAQRLNTDLPGELAALCAEAGTRLVHVSTDQVFDGTRGGWTETDRAAPLHLYGETKLAGERAVLERDPAAAIVRPALVTGEAPAGRRSATTGLLAALARGETPNMFTDEVRSPVAVDDVARALVDLVRIPAAGVFHCGGPRAMTRYELACLELERRGRDSASVGQGTRAAAGLDRERPADLSLDSSRLIARLGWQPRVLGGD